MIRRRYSSHRAAIHHAAEKNPIIIIIIEGLRDKLHSGAKSLIGKKGYRRYLKVARESVTIDLGALSEIDVPIRFCPIGRFK